MLMVSARREPVIVRDLATQKHHRKDLPRGSAIAMTYWASIRARVGSSLN